MKKQVNIFIAYSREDTDYVNKLRKYLFPLQRNKDIKIWYDGEIIAGTVWEEEIKKNLHAADIILLLVSSNSLYSQYFYEKEVKEALERHEAEQTMVIPVILGACLWEETPLRDLQVLPKDAVPINKWPNESDAYMDVVQGVRKCISIIHKRRKKSAKPVALLAEQKKQKKVQGESNAKIQWRKRMTQIIMFGIFVLLIIGISDIIKQFLENKSVGLISFRDMNNKGKYGFLNEKGDTVVKPIYDDVGKFDGKYIAVEKDNKWGYIDQFGKIVVPLEYDNVNFKGFENEMVLVTKGRAKFYINAKNKCVKDCPRKSEPIKLSKSIQKLINDMVYVQGGTFRIGCDEQRDGDCENNEKPVHNVTLSSYKIGKYEVTQAQWQAVMGNNPSYFQGCDNCPVEQVSWNDVETFIKKLNSLTNKKFRLPTEAEWEYAARGGNRSNAYKYAGTNTLDEVAWYGSNSSDKTHEVGSKNKSNELGLYDMSGNVYEWCRDEYSSKYYSNSSNDNPFNDGIGHNKVLRGGHFKRGNSSCRIANRSFAAPSDKNTYQGFRLASSL